MATTYGRSRGLAGVLGSHGGRFGRVEPRRTAAAFVTGLLSDLEVKTCWQLAEQAGHARPYAMQRLMYQAVSDADTVRDDLRQVVIDRFGDPDAVLGADHQDPPAVALQSTYPLHLVGGQ